MWREKQRPISDMNRETVEEREAKENRKKRLRISRMEIVRERKKKWKDRYINRHKKQRTNTYRLISVETLQM